MKELCSYARANICRIRKPFGEGTLKFMNSKKIGYN